MIAIAIALFIVGNLIMLIWGVPLAVWKLTGLTNKADSLGAFIVNCAAAILLAAILQWAWQNLP